jgi:uncharacterized protein (TIGR00299 family) protein
MSASPPPERWAYFDCFAGISGDMTLGALIDLGVKLPGLKKILKGLGLPAFRLEARRVAKEHLTGVQIAFECREDKTHRTYPDLVGLIEAAALGPRGRQLALKMLRLLGEAEARIHGQPLEQVHFHELGALDTILDVVGVAYGVEQLGITRAFASPLPAGWGMIAGAHGRLPNPAPATLELLKGLSVYGTDLPGELVTPTGAAILKALEAESAPCPALRLEGVGYGAGTRDLPGHPNLLRLYLGRPRAAAAGLTERVLVLETHIDDMNPELYEPLLEALFAAGALDVALAPLIMKKNRPGVRLTVVAPPTLREALLDELFAGSTTLGVRLSEVERVAARRWQETLDTPYGPLTVKVAEYGGRRRVMPEYEACRQMAREQGLPLMEVYRLVNRE